jgi:hypothetical protein
VDIVCPKQLYSVIICWGKIEVLAKHGIYLTKEVIKDVILIPYTVESGYKERMIAQKRINKEHVLRVVYKESCEQILVITVYPGRVSRYEKN